MGSCFLGYQPRSNEQPLARKVHVVCSICARQNENQHHMWSSFPPRWDYRRHVGLSAVTQRSWACLGGLSIISRGFRFGGTPREEVCTDLLCRLISAAEAGVLPCSLLCEGKKYGIDLWLSFPHSDEVRWENYRLSKTSWWLAGYKNHEIRNMDTTQRTIFHAS